MALSVDTRKVVKAEVVPWEPGQYGVARKTGDGQHGAERIGKKEDAQEIVDDIAQRRA